MSQHRTLSALALAGALALPVLATPAPAADLYGYHYGKAPVAQSPCGQWPHNLASDWGNGTYSNFGCATAHNLATMLEDPRDLYGPRPTTPRDSQRRGAMFESWRAGENPSGTWATDQAGSASDIGD